MKLSNLRNIRKIIITTELLKNAATVIIKQIFSKTKIKQIIGIFYKDDYGVYYKYNTDGKFMTILSNYFK